MFKRFRILNSVRAARATQALESSSSVAPLTTEGRSKFSQI